jgi:hypothetical protein
VKATSSARTVKCPHHSEKLTLLVDYIGSGLLLGRKKKAPETCRFFLYQVAFGTHSTLTSAADLNKYTKASFKYDGRKYLVLLLLSVVGLLRDIAATSIMDNGCYTASLSYHVVLGVTTRSSLDRLGHTSCSGWAVLRFRQLGLMREEELVVMA